MSDNSFEEEEEEYKQINQNINPENEDFLQDMKNQMENMTVEQRVEQKLKLLEKISAKVQSESHSLEISLRSNNEMFNGMKREHERLAKSLTNIKPLEDEQKKLEEKMRKMMAEQGNMEKIRQQNKKEMSDLQASYHKLKQNHIILCNILKDVNPEAYQKYLEQIKLKENLPYWGNLSLVPKQIILSYLNVFTLFSICTRVSKEFYSIIMESSFLESFTIQELGISGNYNSEYSFFGPKLQSEMKGNFYKIPKNCLEILKTQAIKKQRPLPILGFQSTAKNAKNSVCHIYCSSNKSFVVDDNNAISAFGLYIPNFDLTKIEEVDLNNEKEVEGLINKTSEELFCFQGIHLAAGQRSRHTFGAYQTELMPSRVELFSTLVLGIHNLPLKQDELEILESFNDIGNEEALKSYLDENKGRLPKLISTNIPILKKKGIFFDTAVECYSYAEFLIQTQNTNPHQNLQVLLWIKAKSTEYEAFHILRRKVSGRFLTTKLIKKFKDEEDYTPSLNEYDGKSVMITKMRKFKIKGAEGGAIQLYGYPVPSLLK